MRARPRHTRCAHRRVASRRNLSASIRRSSRTHLAPHQGRRRWLRRALKWSSRVRFGVPPCAWREGAREAEGTLGVRAADGGLDFECAGALDGTEAESGPLGGERSAPVAAEGRVAGARCVAASTFACAIAMRSPGDEPILFPATERSSTADANASARTASASSLLSPTRGTERA